MAYLREKLEFLRTKEDRKQKLKEEWLAIEREKIALEREKMKEEFKLRKIELASIYEWKKMELEREMALREEELKFKYNK